MHVTTLLYAAAENESRQTRVLCFAQPLISGIEQSWITWGFESHKPSFDFLVDRLILWIFYAETGTAQLL